MKNLTDISTNRSIEILSDVCVCLDGKFPNRKVINHRSSIDTWMLLYIYVREKPYNAEEVEKAINVAQRRGRSRDKRQRLS